MAKVFVFFFVQMDMQNLKGGISCVYHPHHICSKLHLLLFLVQVTTLFYCSTHTFECFFPRFNMPFVVLRIKSYTHTIKEWYGCMVSELHTFIDTFRDFSSGDIDKGVSICPEYWCSSVKVSKTKTLSADSL